VRSCARTLVGGSPRSRRFVDARRPKRCVQRFGKKTSGGGDFVGASASHSFDDVDVSGSFDWFDDEDDVGITSAREESRKRREEERGVGKGKASSSPARAGRPGVDQELTLSLLLPFGEGALPPKGKTRTKKDEECDPWTQNCRTELHVWESKCTACYGTGKVVTGSRGPRSRRRARRYGAGSGSMRMTATCVKCLGTGYVRHSSARTIPNPFPNGNPNAENIAAARKSMTFESGEFESE